MECTVQYRDLVLPTVAMGAITSLAIPTAMFVASIAGYGPFVNGVVDAAECGPYQATIGLS